MTQFRRKYIVEDIVVHCRLIWIDWVLMAGVFIFDKLLLVRQGKCLNSTLISDDARAIDAALSAHQACFLLSGFALPVACWYLVVLTEMLLLWQMWQRLLQRSLARMDATSWHSV